MALFKLGWQLKQQYQQKRNGNELFSAVDNVDKNVDYDKSGNDCEDVAELLAGKVGPPPRHNEVE